MNAFTRPESEATQRTSGNSMRRSLLDPLTPSATNMIRFDHSHVMLTFHQYQSDTRPAQKKALVNTICLALEIHAQLEEEIFYPAVAAVATDDPVLAKSVPEHDEMRRLIGIVRDLKATDIQFDKFVMELMRDVLHHVADEETVVLPEAEKLLGQQRLTELGAAMTRRRLELTAPKAGAIALNTFASLPASKFAMVAGALGAIACGTLLLTRRNA